MVFDFPTKEDGPLYAQLNAPLFNWVTENLLRNALDAMGGEGKISAVVTEEKDFINIDISSTSAKKSSPEKDFLVISFPFLLFLSTGVMV